jgi:hypothetical protein
VENADGTKTPFKEQPDFIGNLIVDWHHPAAGTTISLAINYVEEIKPSSIHDGRDSETFVDIRVSQPLSDEWSVYLLGANLTDEHRTKLKPNGEIEREETDPTLWVGLEGRF